MIPAEVRARVVESRRRQGKPDVIEDPGFLAALAAALLEQAQP